MNTPGEFTHGNDCTGDHPARPFVGREGDACERCTGCGAVRVVHRRERDDAIQQVDVPTLTNFALVEAVCRRRGLPFARYDRATRTFDLIVDPTEGATHDR